MGQMLGFAAGSLLGGLGAEHLGYWAPFVILAVWQALASVILFRLLKGRKVTDGVTAHRFTLREFVAGIAYVWRQPWARVVLITVFLEGTFMFGSFAFIATHLHLHYGISLTFAGVDRDALRRGRHRVRRAVAGAGAPPRRSGPRDRRRRDHLRDARRRRARRRRGRSRRSPPSQWAWASTCCTTRCRPTRRRWRRSGAVPRCRSSRRRCSSASRSASRSRAIVAQTFDTGVVLLSGAAGVLAVALAFAWRRRHRRAAVRRFRPDGIAPIIGFRAYSRRLRPLARPALAAGRDGARIRVQRRQDARRRRRDAPAIPTLDELAAAEIDGVAPLPRRAFGRALRRDRPAERLRTPTRIPPCRLARAVLPRARVAGGDRRARVPGRRVGPHASLLRSLRNADARQGGRTREGMPGVQATLPIRAYRRR